MVNITIGKIIHLSTDLVLISTLLSTIHTNTQFKLDTTRLSFGNSTVKYYLDWYLKLGDSVIDYSCHYVAENKSNTITQFFTKK
ncbi:Mco8 protein [Hanseniaspora uvarum]|nr:Mco8 protein [Hanseniaspora uvarum]